jgi:hypothetical protein
VIGLAVCLSAALCGPAVAAPVDAAETFERAVEAYRAEDWSTARSLWLEVLADPASGLNPADALFDLGNTAWRQGEPLEAAAWYTACIRVEPRHAAAWANLEFVRAEAGLEPADRGDLSSTLRRLLGALTPGEAEWLAVGCTALLAAALVLEALRGGAFLRRVSIGATVVLLVGAVPWLWNLRGGPEHPVFVVNGEGAALHSRPADEGALVGRLLPGTEAARVDALPDWVRVEASGGARGWVRSDDVLPIAAPFDSKAAPAH